MSIIVSCSSNPAHQKPDGAQHVQYGGRPKAIQFSELKRLKFLVQGAQSQVFQATYKGVSTVVKACRPDLPLESGTASLAKEIEVLENLNHKNIVQLKGYGQYTKGDTQRLFIVYEYLSGGTLGEKIWKARRMHQAGRQVKFDMSDALKYALMISKGMEFLHLNKITHRDLKPDNLVFGSDGELKIVDFSLSAQIPDDVAYSTQTYQMTGNTGTPRYMAPEVAKQQPYNSKVDVYSFTMILWEMLTLKPPFGHMSMKSFRKSVIFGNQRPKIDSKWPEELKELLVQGWSTDINKRPNFKQICCTLTGILAAIK